MVDFAPPQVLPTPSDHRDQLLEAGLVLSSDLSLPLVLERIVAVACELTRARYGALGVLGPEGTVVDFVTRGLSAAQRRRIGALPTGRGVLGALIADARPLRLADLTRDHRAAGFPPHHPPMTSFLGAPVMARGRVFGNIYLTDKRGAPEFDGEDERSLRVLAGQAGVAIANATLHEEALARERWLEAAQAITSAIIGGSTVEAVLALVAGRARHLLDADRTLIAVPGAGGGPGLRVEVADGRGAAHLRGRPLPPLGGAAERVMRTGRSVVLEAVPSRPQGTARGPGAGGGPAALVPLAVRDRALGVLAVLGGPGQRPLGPEALRLVQGFASQAAMALEYCGAQRDLQRLALLDERERIAKELHDGVIQSLFAVGMGLQAAATLAGPSEVERHIESAVGELDHVIGDLRNYIFALRPGILADHGLDQALRRLAVEFEARCGVQTAVQIDAATAERLADRAPDLVQLTREALSNVGRHARAGTCRVRLRPVRGTAVLTVDDDGDGFDPSAARAGGQGLRNMEERMARLGGRVAIRSRPTRGTTLRVTLPLG